MPFSGTDMLYGGFIPAMVAGFVLVALRLLPEKVSQRYAAPAALTAGFLTGYALLGLAPWAAASHWHWLPYAVIAAALVGPVAQGARGWERVLPYTLAAAAAGWVLVPTWQDMEPARWVYLVGFVAYVAILASLLEPLAKRVAGPLLPGMMAVAMTAAAIILVLSGSLRFAQIAGCGAGALVGCLVVASVYRRENMMTGGAIVFSVMIAGSLLIAELHSESGVPWISYVLVPLAPLALWLGTLRPVEKLACAPRVAVRVCLALVPVLIAVTLALVAYFGENTGEY